MRKNSKKRTKKLLPFAVINRSVNGEVEAINAVLKHFDGYITYLSSMQLGENVGNPQRGYDVETYNRLRTKLIARISKFNMNKV